jgi:hypothetical protein
MRPETSLAADDWVTQGEVEAGAGYVFDDEYRFGRYNGLTDDGAVAVINADIQRRRDDGAYQRLEADRLGIDSRYLEFGAGIQGRYGLSLDYNQIPNNQFDTARTPFRGVGSDRLALPADWVDAETTGEMTALDASLRDFDIETERKRYGLGAYWLPKANWKTRIRFSREERDGTDVIGGAIGRGFGLGRGGVRSSILPEPVDYETDQLDVTADYVRDKGQLQLAYRYSGFSNDNRSLTWDNPFISGAGGGGGGGGQGGGQGGGGGTGTGAGAVDPGGAVSDTGRIALAPDNQFHQASVSGGYQLQPTTRVSGNFSLGWQKQDEDFVPASINADFADLTLPRNSLDAEALVTSAFLRLHSRPIQKLRLTGSYRYYDRDLDVDRDSYPQVRLDSGTTASQKNRPFDYHRHDVALDGRYRLTAKADVSVGYDYESLSRDYQDAEREDTHENRLSASLKYRPVRELTATLYGSLADRGGSDYEPLEFENPLLRKYHLADREQNTAGIRMAYVPVNWLSFTGKAEVRDDDYDDTEIGLTDAKRNIYFLEAAYVPGGRFSGHASVTHETIDSKQRGDSTAAGDTWRVDQEDTITTWGLGGELDVIPDRLSFSVDYIYSDGKGETGVTRADPYIPFTDVTTKLHSLRLQARYRYSEQLDFRLAFWHESLDGEDWALDDVDPDTVPTVLLTGEETPDYSNNVMALTAIYRFGK